MLQKFTSANGHNHKLLAIPQDFVPKGQDPRSQINATIHYGWKVATYVKRRIGIVKRGMQKIVPPDDKTSSIELLVINNEKKGTILFSR